MFRRTYLALAAGGVSTGLSGCVTRTDAQPARELQANVDGVARNDDGTVTVAVEYQNSAHMGGEDWETFHDVRLLAYSRAGELLSEQSLGDVPRGNFDDNAPVGLECESIPASITFEASESPCDDDTVIAVTYYRGTEDGEHRWEDYGERECGEGLPPAWKTPSG